MYPTSFVLAALLLGPAFLPLSSSVAAETTAELAQEVREVEQAFARAMADRDLTAFGSFLAEETVFVSDGRTLRGRQAVIEGWAAYFQAEEAPFSWQPERVEVLDSATLALSTGPVLDPQGRRVGTFTSIWRREVDGRWRIVFDRGCPVCEDP